ncbi:DNA polymerase I [Dirofilaria immitis]|nr:DNA polymerase I [Dirofilaria immitis]
MIVTFCEKLGWTYLRNVLDGFSERLAFGVRKDLTELVQIEGIDGIRARAFHNANITTVPILAITSIDDVTKILRSVVPYIRRDNNEGLNRWLAGESLMTDIEAAEILIQRARLHLSSSIRAIGIFSDTKIDSLLSTVTSICETNHASLDALSSKCDNNNMDSHSVFSDFEPASHNFSMHGNFPITTTSENSEEQNTTSTQCLIQTSEVIEIEKRSSKMKLLGSNNLYQMEQVVLHDSLVIKQENPNVPDKFDSDNVEQFEVIEKRPSKMKLLESDNLDQMEQVVLRNSLVIKQENPNVPDKFDSDNVEQFEVNEKQPSKMKLLSSDNLDEVSKSILHDHSVINQENSNIPAILVSDNVEQLCVDFAQTSMSDETLLQFGCSQYSDKYEQITQALDAIAVLARNEQSQMISTTTATSAVIHNMQDDNVEMNEKKHFINSKLKKSSINQSIGSSSTIEYVASQQIILESIDEEKGIVSNSDESIGNRSVFNNSNDLFDRTYCSSISSQSFNTPQNSSYCMKRISRRSSINHQSPKSPSFQSPLHKMLKPGSPLCNLSRTAWKQLLIRQKNWNEIGLGIAIYNNDIIGIALCTTNDECVYIDFKPNYTSEIEIHECLRVLDNILKSKQQKYIYDLLSFSRSLRYLRDTNCQTLSFNHCICIQTLSYLAHYRTLNNDSALSFQDLITQLTSPERAIILRNATPRLQAAITAFICLHMHNDLMSAAIRLSSTKSVELELQSIKQKLAEIEAKAYRIAGISFNFCSAAEISQVLFVRLQIPPPNISTGRHYSTNKIALQRLAPNYPIINLILEWRRLNTALTTSLPALLNSSCADGRIRANFIVHCCTGRVLTAHPNVQNVQKMQSSMVFPFDHYSSLQKMRMLAHLSADPQLISLFFTEGDFFEIITNRWNNDETLNIKIDRNKVKQLCYGIIYGMGATSLSKELDIDKQHAQQMIVSFFQQFPKVRTWMDKILTICRTDGFVSTLLGRRRFLPQINGVLQTESAQAQRQAINTCIQGSVAELFKIALLNLQKNLLGTNSSIVMQIHDEVLIETDECSIATIVEIIKHSMTSVIPNLRIPLAVKISYGKSWGELREYVEI